MKTEKNTTPTFLGEPSDAGKLTPGTMYPGEGFAVLKCGNTEVILGYTLLNHLRFEVPSDSRVFMELVAANKALASITCEAGLGRTATE